MCKHAKHGVICATHSNDPNYHWSYGWRCKLNLLLLIFFQHLLGGHLISTSIETVIHFKSLFVSFRFSCSFRVVIEMWTVFNFVLQIQSVYCCGRVVAISVVPSVNIAHQSCANIYLSALKQCNTHRTECRWTLSGRPHRLCWPGRAQRAPLIRTQNISK